MKLHRRNRKKFHKKKKKEHIRNVKNNAKGSIIASYAWTNDHVTDFDKGKVIDKGNYLSRKTLQSWHTALTDGADNGKPLPGQYAILLKK